MSNVRESMTVDGYSTKAIADCVMLDVSEPKSAVFRVEKKTIVGRDGFWHDDKAGVDGVERNIVFETRTDTAYRKLTNLLYPGRYSPMSFDYMNGLFFYGLVKQFHVEEMGFSDGNFVRVITFDVLAQPYVMEPVQTLTISNGTWVENPGATTEDFRLRLYGNTGVDGTKIRFQHQRMGWDMTVRVVGQLHVDNARKNLYNQYGALVNTNRKSGFFYKLLPGETQITWTGTNITRAELTVSWRYYA